MAPPRPPPLLGSQEGRLSSPEPLAGARSCPSMSLDAPHGDRAARHACAGRAWPGCARAGTEGSPRAHSRPPGQTLQERERKEMAVLPPGPEGRGPPEALWTRTCCSHGEAEAHFAALRRLASPGSAPAALPEAGVTSRRQPFTTDVSSSSSPLRRPVCSKTGSKNGLRASPSRKQSLPPTC